MRRMISLLNLIVRRGHNPREVQIRRLMESMGLQVLPNVDDTEPHSGELSDEEGELSEGVESSVETDDVPVEDVDVKENPMDEEGTSFHMD